ncbi:MAG: hypothetical protein V3V66_02245, partial [Anaerolineales bacterium]
IVAVLLGAVIYFSAVGWIPYLDNRIFQPIDNNLTQLQELVETQSVIEDQIASILATLDTSQSAQEESTSLHQATLEALQQDLQQLKDNTDNLFTAVSGNTYMSTQIQLQMATLTAKQSANDRHISALATVQMSRIGIYEEIELLKVLDLLSRANQFLLHSNYGQAEEILQSALIELTELQERLPGFQQDAISSILDLVEQTIIDLPAKPTLAAEKLELAWQLGITGLPQLGYGEFVGTVTPTPYLTPTPTPP